MPRTFIVAVVALCCSVSYADDTATDSSVPPVDQTVTQSPLRQNPPLPILLPSLGDPVQMDATLLPTTNGSLQFKGNIDGNRFLIKQDFNNAKGAPFDVDIATQQIPDTTVGWLISTKPDRAEAIMNMGWRVGSNQQFLFSGAQLRGMVEPDTDVKSTLNLNQTTGGLNYRYFMNRSWLSGIELSGYATQSQTFASTASDASQGRIAGSNLIGLQLGMEASPLPAAKLKIGIGSERLSYDSLSGAEPTQNLNTSIKWSQVLMPTVKYHASVEGNNTERNLSTGLDFNLRDGQQVGFTVARTQWNDGQTTDNAVQFSYTVRFGSKFTTFQPKANKAPWNASLVPEVLQRPSYLPKSVLSKPDSSLN